MTQKVLVGVDGGGTKTEFVMFRAGGQIVGRIVLDGSNPNACGLQASGEVLKRGIDALSAAGCEPVGIFAGIAGSASGGHAAALEAILCGAYPSARIAVGSDILNVMDSVRGAEKCVAVICGTGSAVFARDERGLHRAGGWGYLLDGAGSGFDIGRDALRYCLEYETGLKPFAPLAEAVAARIGGNVLDRLGVLYAKGTEYVASFAPAVFEAYDAGDVVAEEILRGNFARIADLVNVLEKNCDCGDMLILAGGLTARQDIFCKMLLPLLKRRFRHVFPFLPPVYGACLRCMRLFGPEHYDEEVFDAAFAVQYEKLKGEA